MAREEKLIKAYSAIADLRSEQKPVTIASVAKKSKLSRASFYSLDSDWQEVRNVIENNLPHSRIKPSVVTIIEAEPWEINLKKLETMVSNSKEELINMRKTAESVYKKLLSELHKYIILAKESPGKSESRGKYLKELAYYRELSKNLEARIKELEAEKILPVDIRPFVRKEVISVLGEVNWQNAPIDLIDLSLDAINRLDDYFTAEDARLLPSVVHIMCGNFASGKSSWIKLHKSIYPGVNIYIDGPHHTSTIRKSVIKRVKKLNPACRVICVRMMASFEKCMERNRSEIRKRVDAVVPENICKLLEKDFEEVSLEEGFDSVELAREKV